MDKKLLDIIVEEFFDTGRLVLNEELDENGKSPKIGRLINLSKSINDIFFNRDINNECTEDSGDVESCLNKFRALVEMSNIWFKEVVPLIDKMDEDEKDSISRGGQNQFNRFRNKDHRDVDRIEELVKIISSNYLRNLNDKSRYTIHKIHDIPVQLSINERQNRINKYKELKDIIVNNFNQLPQWETKKSDKWVNIINANIWLDEVALTLKHIKGSNVKLPQDIINSFEELKKKLIDFNDYTINRILTYYKKSKNPNYYYDIFQTKNDIIEWIDNNINRQKEKRDTAYILPNTDNTGLDVVKDYLEYKSTITQEDSERSFSELVNDIGVEIVEDEDFPDILSNYVIDKELLKQRKDILDEIKKINSKIDNIKKKQKERKVRGDENWKDEGKTKLPQYENEKENLEEQLRIIDPIKALFDSDSGWGNNYINCGPNDKYSNYLAEYYGTTPKEAHKALLTRHQISMVNTPDSTIGEINCRKYNLENLISEIGGVPNRENIKNELTDNFIEYQENDVITNLVNKSINLVDNIFKMIIDKEIFSKVPLQKYKSYMNMIKIYSEGENQKEKLTQLVYDLNQLKNVVESYDVLTDTAESPQTSDEEDTQEEGTKLLSKKELQLLLNKISENSWDREEIKDYFVKVREHNNVAYEKSFEKECNEIQYFKKVTGGDRPRIIDETNNNTHLVNYILSADTEDKYISTEKIVETIFSEVKDLLNNEDAIERRLKKYDLEVLSRVTLTQKNGTETFELLPSEEKYIEVKDTKPKDYHFSEFFGVYKSTKSKVYKRMKNLLDDEETDENENFERYNEFVKELVEKLISVEGKQIIDIIKSKLQGIFFEKYQFCPIDNIRFSWSTVGQGKEGGREKRVTIRIEPIDYDKIYVWEEGNTNCGKRQYFEGCEENPGCPSDSLEESITNFFDTGNFEF